MAASRSLIVDTLPISKQQSGSAWGKIRFLWIRWALLRCNSKQTWEYWKSTWLCDRSPRLAWYMGRLAGRLTVQATMRPRGIDSYGLLRFNSLGHYRACPGLSKVSMPFYITNSLPACGDENAKKTIESTKKGLALSGSSSSSSKPPFTFRIEYKLYAGFSSGHG